MEELENKVKTLEIKMQEKDEIIKNLVNDVKDLKENIWQREVADKNDDETEALEDVDEDIVVKKQRLFY